MSRLPQKRAQTHDYAHKKSEEEKEDLYVLQPLPPSRTSINVTLTFAPDDDAFAQKDGLHDVTDSDGCQPTNSCV